VYAYYQVAGKALGLGSTPPPLAPERTLVVVPVNSVSNLAADALRVAKSLGQRVVALSVQPDAAQAAQFEADWSRWNPGVELVVLRPDNRSVVGPIVSYVSSPEVKAEGRVVVLIAEIEPQKWRHQVLQNQRGLILANRLRRQTDAVVARLPLRLQEGSGLP
jgi:hypothetical protein